MPVTPLHFGAALPIKLLRGDKFSVKVFCYANLFMDAEVVFRVLVEVPGRLHGGSHTLLYAVFLAALTAIVAWDYAESVLWAGGTHVLLDALVHSDVQPFWPLSANPLYGDAMAGVSIALVISLSLGLAFFTGPWSGMAARGQARLEAVRFLLARPFAKWLG